MASPMPLLLCLILIATAAVRANPMASEEAGGDRTDEEVPVMLDFLVSAVVDTLRNQKPAELFEMVKALANLTAESSAVSEAPPLLQKGVIEGTEMAEQFAKENPKTAEDAKDLLASGIEAGSTYIKDHPIIITKGMEFLKEHGEITQGVGQLVQGLLTNAVQKK